MLSLGDALKYIVDIKIYCKTNIFKLEKRKYNCNIRSKTMVQAVLQHLTIRLLHVTKNKLTDKDKMISSNSYIYELKCYINVFYVVPSEMEGYLP